MFLNLLAFGVGKYWMLLNNLLDCFLALYLNDLVKISGTIVEYTIPVCSNANFRIFFF